MEQRNKELKEKIIYLSEILSFLFKRKKAIIIPISFITIISAVWLYFIPNKYTATASFIPPAPDLVASYSDSIESLSFSEIPISFGRSMGSFLEDPNKIYISILNSKTIKKAIIEKFDLMEMYDLDYIEDAYAKLNKLVTIESRDSLIKISVETENPELSSKIANLYLDRFSLILSEINQLNLKNNQIFLEKRLTEVRDNLRVARENLKKFELSNNTVSLEKQGEALITGVANLHVEIISAEAELKSLLSRYTDNSPQIKSLKAKIESLRKELFLLRGKNIYQDNSPNFIENIGLMDIPNIKGDYINLYQDVAIAEQVLILLTKQYELNRIKEVKEMTNIKILDIADIPTKKSFPPRAIILALIIFLTTVIIFTYNLLKFHLFKLKDMDPLLHESLMALFGKRGNKDIISVELEQVNK